MLTDTKDSIEHVSHHEVSTAAVKASICVRWVQDAIFGAQFVDPDKLPQVFFRYLAARV